MSKAPPDLKAHRGLKELPARKVQRDLKVHKALPALRVLLDPKDPPARCRQ